MFQRAASKSDLENGKIWGGKVGDRHVAVFIVNGEAFATDRYCSHEDCMFDMDGWVEGEAVECGCHGGRFSIRTGEVLALPPEDPVNVYRAELRGDDVYVDVPEA